MFKLELTNSVDSRWAIYDPLRSSLFWADDQTPVLPVKALDDTVPAIWQKVHALSPQQPASKEQNPELIKIQLGFACNYSCTYCSQNNQRTRAERVAASSSDRTKRFIEQMPGWFKGGLNGAGLGSRVEFWGGETLLYWEAVTELTVFLRQRYPDIQLVLFTNGSLIKPEMADFAKKHRLHFSISHDGPGFIDMRNKRDPLSEKGNRTNIRYLFNTLSPLGLVSFNAALSPKNYSLLAIRKYIAEALEVSDKEVALSFDLITPYDEGGKNLVVDPAETQRFINHLFDEWKSLSLNDMRLGRLDQLLAEFYKGIEYGRAGDTYPQRCQMDSPDSLAVDLDGNVLTCQNVTAKGGHKIGHVSAFDQVRLNTSYHWSQRKECGECPVVSMCRGACMFLTDQLWSRACDQFFAFHLALLAFALYLGTDRYLTRIEAPALRRLPDQRAIDVINLRSYLSSKIDDASSTLSAAHTL